MPDPKYKVHKSVDVRVTNCVGSRDGAVVIALVSRQCGPGSIPGPDALNGLSLCWFSYLLQGFFSRFSGFPPLAETSMQLIPSGCDLCSKVTHGPHSGCQGGFCMLSVRPCWAASLLYFATAISRDILHWVIVSWLQLSSYWNSSQLFLNDN